MALSQRDAVGRVQGKQKPHIEEKNLEAGKPIRDRPAAGVSPFRFTKGQAEIAGETLHSRNNRVKARQEMKTVVSQPHAEPKRDQRKRKTDGHLQPRFLQLSQPTAQTGRDRSDKNRATMLIPAVRQGCRHCHEGKRGCSRGRRCNPYCSICEVETGSTRIRECRLDRECNPWFGTLRRLAGHELLFPT